MCGYPPNLIESELFEYEKGVFTGTLHMRKEKFEA
ncbi:sigma 54-interacting transcriptional regulator [Bacillus sp. FSL K6-0043]